MFEESIIHLSFRVHSNAATRLMDIKWIAVLLHDVIEVPKSRCLSHMDSLP